MFVSPEVVWSKTVGTRRRMTWMRKRTSPVFLSRSFFGVGLTALWILCSCQDRGDSLHSRPKKEVVLEPTDQFPVFDVYFTWTHSAQRGSRFDASSRYIWNGEDIGISSRADGALLAKFRGLPVGSRVLIYPSYYLKWQMRLQMGTDYPFINIYPDIFKIMCARQLTLYYSPWDHLGHLHPDCIEPGTATAPSTMPTSTHPDG